MEPISATYIRSVSSNSPKTWPRFDFRVSMSCFFFIKLTQKMRIKTGQYRFYVLADSDHYKSDSVLFSLDENALHLNLHFDFECDAVMNYHYLD